MAEMERTAAKERAELAGQVIRYGVTGGGIAALYAAVYWCGAVMLAVSPQVANAAGFVAALVVGYSVHSSWSFRGHGRRDRPVVSSGRFLLVNLAGYALNALWVWTVVDRLAQPPAFSILPIVLVTPMLTFWLNRRWTFA